MWDGGALALRNVEVAGSIRCQLDGPSFAREGLPHGNGPGLLVSRGELDHARRHRPISAHRSSEVPRVVLEKDLRITLHGMSDVRDAFACPETPRGGRSKLSSTSQPLGSANPERADVDDSIAVNGLDRVAAIEHLELAADGEKPAACR